MLYNLHSNAYLRRKWRDYCGFLQSKPSQPILDHYVKHGGEAARLRAFLWTLRERQIKQGLNPLRPLRVMSRPAQDALKRAAKSLQTLLHHLKGEQIEDTLSRSCHASLTRLEDHMEWLQIHRRIKQIGDSITDMKDQSLRRSGRGPTKENILAAVLVEEFKRRFRRAHYEWALTLLHEVAPNKFKMDTEKGHGPDELRDRVRRVNRDNREIVTRLHQSVFL
jgi:hypothetical protein